MVRNRRWHSHERPGFFPASHSIENGNPIRILPLFFWSGPLAASQMTETIRISMLHSAPRHDDISYNIRLIESMFFKALEVKPDIVVMPELAVSGYEFYHELGIDWVKDFAPELINRFRSLAETCATCIILCTPSYDPDQEKYFNAAIFINEMGDVLGEHQKVTVLTGSEGWASPGRNTRPIDWKGHKIGLLICSDAYGRNVASELATQGADVLISPAAWAPGFHGPDGEWELRSEETGLNLFVCNRTGKENKMEFNGSASVVVTGGKRIISYSEPEPAILTADVDAENWRLLSDAFIIVSLEETT
jgi:predicted amidohydrolase